MLDVGIDGLLERELLGPVLVDGQHVHAEGGLQRGELEELVDDHLRAGVAFQLNLDACFLIGEVAHAGDAGEGLLVDEFGDAFLEHGAVDAVGHLADDDERFAAFVFLDFHLAAQAHRAAAGAEVILDAADAADFAGDREIRPLDVLHQLGQRDLRVVDLGADPVDHLAEVVRGEVGGHADGDAGAAVDEEVREGGGQDRGLLLRAVVVRLEIDRVLVEIVHHRHAEVMEARLGVSHGRRGVAFHRAEVALAVHQQLAHRPRLAHVHEGRVNRLVAVRVEVTHRFPDDLGAFHVGLPGRNAELAHGVEDAPLGRLQAVAHVGQSAGNDHRHRVFQERLGKFLGDVDGLDGIV